MFSSSFLYTIRHLLFIPGYFTTPEIKVSSLISPINKIRIICSFIPRTCPTILEDVPSSSLSNIT